VPSYGQTLAGRVIQSGGSGEQNSQQRAQKEKVEEVANEAMTKDEGVPILQVSCRWIAVNGMRTMQSKGTWPQ